jgi:hypothetical protein
LPALIATGSRWKRSRDARGQGRAGDLLTVQTDLTSDAATDEITTATRDDRSPVSRGALGHQIAAQRSSREGWCVGVMDEHCDDANYAKPVITRAGPSPRLNELAVKSAAENLAPG